MSEFRLSDEQEQLLRGQVIDADRPGRVLRDLETVLEGVGTDGVKAAGKYNLLPIDLIGPLDARLSRPLRLKLQRPQLRSHPYLQGLHLLGRTSGLTHVVGTGDKARLVVDQALLASWRSLNPTEQYFTLLEAWLRNSRGEMVGQGGRGWDTPLMECLQAWQYLPREGARFKFDRPNDFHLYGIFGRNYHLALMDLFGLLDIEPAKQPGTHWIPPAVRHTPYGDALLTLLKAWFEEYGFDDIAEREESAGPVRFGRWQPLFQPYFPEWRHNLELPEPEVRDGVFVFRVSWGKMWRLIAMPADATLDDLFGVILDSVKFDDDHLYEFTYRDRFGAAVSALDPRAEDGFSADQVVIGELPLEPGQAMKLTYDFGDNWQFAVKLEQIEPGKRLKKPKILERHGKAPKQYPEYDTW